MKTNRYETFTVLHAARSKGTVSESEIRFVDRFFHERDYYASNPTATVLPRFAEREQAADEILERASRPNSTAALPLAPS